MSMATPPSGTRSTSISSCWSLGSSLWLGLIAIEVLLSWDLTMLAPVVRTLASAARKLRLLASGPLRRALGDLSARAGALVLLADGSLLAVRVLERDSWNLLHQPIGIVAKVGQPAPALGRVVGA